MSLILMTTPFYKALILQGEIWCWSLWGLKGLKQIEDLPWKCTLHGLFCRISSAVVLYNYFILFFFVHHKMGKAVGSRFGKSSKKNQDFVSFAREIAFTIRQVKHHVYVKRQTRICNTWPSFLFTCRLLFIISILVSLNLLTIRIVLTCFYLLIFHFEKFSTWIWRLLFAVYVKLKLSICANIFEIEQWWLMLETVIKRGNRLYISHWNT